MCNQNPKDERINKNTELTAKVFKALNTGKTLPLGSVTVGSRCTINAPATPKSIKDTETDGNKKISISYNEGFGTFSILIEKSGDVILSYDE